MIIARNYWLDLFTGKTWEEFLAAGGTVSGFRETRCPTVFRMKPGDYLLCYMTGISRWIGIFEVVGDPFKSTDSIWKDEVFPCRVPVRVVSALKPETSVPVLDMATDCLSLLVSRTQICGVGPFEARLRSGSRPTERRLSLRLLTLQSIPPSAPSTPRNWPGAL